MKHLRYALIAFGLLFASQAEAATCFWVGGTGTWSTSNTASWASATGGTAGSCAATGGIPKQSADTATFDGSSGGGTVTVDTTINGVTLTQITMGAFTGTLDFSVNNPSMTMQTLSGTGSGARTLKMGSGVFTLTSATSPLNFTTTTGLTLNAGTSTLAINGATTVAAIRTIIPGAVTWATITISDPGNSGAYTDITSAAGTITTLNLTAPLVLRLGVPFTITNAINWAGTAYNNSMSIFNAVGASTNTITLSSAGGTINWAALAGVHFATNTATATNSFNLQGNANVTITGPSGGGGGHIIGG